MRKLREVLSVSTLVPVLLSGQTMVVRADDVLREGASAPVRIAQAAPAAEEEPHRRRTPGEHPQGAGQPPRPAQQAPGQAPRPSQPSAAPDQPAPAARNPVEHREPARPHAPDAPRPAAPSAPPSAPAAAPSVPVAPPAAQHRERPAVQPPAPAPAPSTAPAVVAPHVPTAPVAPQAPTVPSAPRASDVAPSGPQTGAPPAAAQPRNPTQVAPPPAAPTGAGGTIGGGAAIRPHPGQPGPTGMGGPVGGTNRPEQQPQERRGGMTPLGAAAVGAAVGVVGGMLLGGEPSHGLADVQRQRREVRDGDFTVYSEPGRVIVRDADGLRLRHDENERFRTLGGDIREERRGEDFVQDWARPDGSRVITITDADGRLLRRIKRYPDGREVVLLDNGPARPRGEWRRDRVVVAPPRIVDRDRWEVDAGRVDGRVIYETLEAPPVAPLERRYSLDDVRWNRDLRSYMRSVDVDTLTFETGSWTVSPNQYDRLATLADAVNRALARNPNEIFLVEGHTDAVGSDLDNLSLSDRRAQSVATILSDTFRVPPENLVTQGYGEQFLKVQTDGPARENRRVTLRRITPLLERAER